MTFSLGNLSHVICYTDVLEFARSVSTFSYKGLHNFLSYKIVVFKLFLTKGHILIISRLAGHIQALILLYRRRI
jgi:hypothetical protein